MKRISFAVSAEEKKRVEKLMKHYGVTTATQATRLALAKTAEGLS